MKKLICSNILVFAIMLIPFFNAYGIFSQFVHISNGNEKEHNIKVNVEAKENQNYKYKIKLPMLDDHKHCWLIICKDKLPPEKQNFRNYIWYDGPARYDIILKSKMQPTSDKEIQFILNKDFIKKSYVYIDFSQPVFDGGFYYSIDLDTYLKEIK